MIVSLLFLCLQLLMFSLPLVLSLSLAHSLTHTHTPGFIEQTHNRAQKDKWAISCRLTKTNNTTKKKFIKKSFECITDCGTGTSGLLTSFRMLWDDFPVSRDGAQSFFLHDLMVV